MPVSGQPLDSKELQEYELCILKVYQQFCESHHLSYYMSGGTLLGAVRHKGFIPWDDDVDMMMPRQDYMYLLKNFKHERYRVSGCENDPSCVCPFIRIWDTTTELTWTWLQDKPIGVFIDIFPIDGFPNLKIMTRIHMIHLKIIRTFFNNSRITDFSGYRHPVFNRILRNFVHNTPNHYARRLNCVAKKYSYDVQDVVGVKTTGPHLLREHNPKKIFEKTVLLPFEDMKLPAPRGYDTYLRHLYGDYMELPPVEKRKSAHNFLIYKKDGPDDVQRDQR